MDTDDWEIYIPLAAFGFLAAISIYRSCTVKCPVTSSFRSGFHTAVLSFAVAKSISAVLYVLPETTIFWEMVLHAIGESLTFTVLLCLYTHWSHTLQSAGRDSSQQAWKRFLQLNALSYLSVIALNSIEISLSTTTRTWWASSALDLALAAAVMRCGLQAHRLKQRYRQYFDVGVAQSLRWSLLQFFWIMTATGGLFVARAVTRWCIFYWKLPNGFHHVWWWDASWQVSGTSWL